jgi:iron complex outermembrane recepter protein
MNSKAYCGAALCIPLMMAATGVQAQTTPAPAESSTDNGANAQQEAPTEVTVTASRIQRSGYTAPTPTTIIGADQLERIGATNIAQALDMLPSVKADTSSQTNGVRGITPGANYVDLRGLTAIRTLVLVDGERFVPQVTNGVDSNQVDLNQIPALLVDRTEVVTGGASAQWGSDAVAGVVNIILKKNFEGIATDFSGGESALGDDRDVRLGLLAGTALLDHRAHVEAAVDYERNDGVGDVFTRSWGQQGWQLVANPSPSTNHLATNLILPDVQFSTLTPGGIITSGPLKGTAFAPGGVPTTFQYGTLVGATNMVGGGQPGININDGLAIEPWLRRLNLFGRANYEISDSVTAHIDVSYAQTEGGGETLPARDTTPDVISISNPFIPASTRAAMTDDGLTTISVGRADYDIGSQQSDDINTTRRVVAGLDGTVFGDYSWDVSYELGDNKYVQHVEGDRIHSTYNQAINAVVNPANGQIVCASSLTNPNNGCVPLDIFGAGSPSQAAINYVTGTEWSATDYSQQAAAANLRGDPFHTWAGPVSIATGIDYRSEQQNSQTDAISQAAGYESTNSEPLSANFSVTEGYFETVVPFLKDLPGAESLDFDGAVRVSDYSTSAGTQPTWKLGLTYKPLHSLLLRASLSQDIRAPNLFELFSRGNVTNQLITFGTVQSNPFVTTTGNPDLKPETARTLTAGISWQPIEPKGLQFSADYYDIDLKKAIAAVTGQQVATFCAAKQEYYCSLMTFNDGLPATIAAAYLNLASVDINGVDVAANYNLSLDVIHLPGDLRAAFQSNYVFHSWVDSGVGGPVIDRAGEVGPNNPYSFPHLNLTAPLTYTVSGFSLTGQLRYIEAGNYDNTYTSGVQINNNHIPGIVYVDLFLSYQLNPQVQFYGAVNNLLNKSPPPDPASLGYPTNPTYYDMIGTDFRLGVRLKL